MQAVSGLCRRGPASLCVGSSSSSSGHAVCRAALPCRRSALLCGAAVLTVSRRGRVAPGRSGRAVAPPRAVLDVSEATFDQEVLQSSVPVLLDFWAPWCGPCKLMSVVVTQLEKEYGGRLKIVKIETDPNPALVEKYGVYGLPTVMLFREGAAVEGSKREGALSKVKLVAHCAEFGIAAPAPAV